MGNKIIITGGLGFVGRNLVDALIKHSYTNIVVIDDCSNSTDNVPKLWIENNVKILKESICNDEWLSEIKDAKIIYHLACKTLLESNSNPLYDNEVNVVATLKMLEYIHSNNLDPVIVYSSSACVYGITPEQKIDEEYATNPTSPYGVSKLAAEKYIQMYAKNKGLKTVSIRLSNVYGPWQTPSNPYCGVIGKFLNQAMNGEPITIIGDGSQSRDFTYAEDVSNALIDIANCENIYGNVYNISFGKNVTINDLANTIEKSLPGTKRSYVKERDIDDIKHRLLDSSNLEKKITLKHTTLDDGIRKTIDWIKLYSSQM